MIIEYKLLRISRQSEDWLIDDTLNSYSRDSWTVHSMSCQDNAIVFLLMRNTIDASA